jgi:hypothetical protein
MAAGHRIGEATRQSVSILEDALVLLDAGPAGVLDRSASVAPS